MKYYKKYKRSIIFSIVFFALYTAAWIGIVYYESTTVQQQSQAAPSKSKPFVAKNVLAGKTSVSDKTVAGKLDLQRKIIRPSSPQQVAGISQIVQEQGGEVFSADADMVVAYVPKESEETINQSLLATNSTQSIEVDYPTYLTADNPDWGVTRIKAPDVWETTTASGVTVAVIDTGIDYNHNDLRGRYVGGYDTANDDADPYDDHGHGTHVSGIIASSLDGAGIAGVSPGGQILAVKALSGDGTGYISDVVDAVDYAMNNGARVINFSIGSSYNSKALEDKLNEAAARGIVLVASAGNANGGALLYPAAYGSVISVSATDSNDNFASFSSVGAEIAAPGVSITSTVPGNGYAAWSGTSMASPHVAATVALMLANNQTDIRKNLQNTAIDLGPSGTDGYYGYGLIHAKPAALGEDTLVPVITFVSPENEAYLQGTVSVALDIQDEYDVTKVELLINDQKVQEWTAEPYNYSWNTDTVPDGDYVIVARATDENDNVGETKITVKVSDVTPTPTAAPTPTIHQIRQQGESGSVRQDINQEQAQQHRQDHNNVPNSPQEASQKREEKQQENNQPEQAQQAPDVSNINERNQKPEQSSSGQGQGKGNVKGIATNRSLESSQQKPSIFALPGLMLSEFIAQVKNIF